MKIDHGEVTFSRVGDADWLSISLGRDGEAVFMVSTALCDADRDNDHVRVAKALRSLARRLDRVS